MHRARVNAWLLVLLGLLAGCAAADPSLVGSSTIGADPAAATVSARLEPIEAGTATAAPGAPPSRWPSGATCREIIRAAAALPEPVRRGLDRHAAPVAVAVIDRGALLPAAAVGTTVALDLPVRTEDGRDGQEAPCLVAVERSAAARAAPRRQVAHRVVRSTYRRGSHRTANPEHQALRRAIRELDDGEDTVILATGEPGLDLIGLVAGSILGGIERFQRDRAEKRAGAALAATPTSVESAVWEPYTYEVTTIEAERSGRLRVALVDRRLGRSWRTTHDSRETRRFAVAAGRHAKDRDLLAGFGGDVVTATDITVWEQAEPRPPLTMLLAMLAGTAGGGVPADLAATMAAWAAAPLPLPARPDPSDDAPSADRRLTSGTAAVRSGSVEQTRMEDGTHRYRLVEPAAGEGP